MKGFLDTVVTFSQDGHQEKTMEETFKVTQLALPPIETTETLRNIIGTKNLFGTNSKKLRFL